jgi:flagellar biosynthesis activator protein FlaF
MNNRYLNAYNKIGKITSTLRETEARVLTQGAVKLKICLNNWEGRDSRSQLNEALIYNNKIWTVFQSELSKKQNQQPAEIRGNLLKLSMFVKRQISAGMGNPTKSILENIININMLIARGLETGPDKPNNSI